MSKVSRNAPCPCGSGRKLKKCCGAPGAIPYTQADRAAGWDLLERLMVEHADEAELVFAEMWGRYIEREDELPEEFLAMSEEVEAAWFAIDYELDRGARLIDEALGSAPVGRSTRSFLETLSESSMRLYEVLGTVVGSSVSLRDLVEGTEVTVHERTASRSLVRHECIAARVVQRGSSGQPELERGVLRIPELARQGLIEEVRAMRAEFFEVRPAAAAVDFYRTLPPLYHVLWLSSFLDPPLPELVDASTGRGLRRREEGSWDWVDVNAAGRDVSLGTLELARGRLVISTNSAERGPPRVGARRGPGGAAAGPPRDDSRGHAAQGERRDVGARSGPS